MKMKSCEFCGREVFLWGGETCDICDSNSDGTLDRHQPVGIETSTAHFLSPPEKGFVITHRASTLIMRDCLKTVARSQFPLVLAMLARKIDFKGAACDAFAMFTPE